MPVLDGTYLFIAFLMFTVMVIALNCLSYTISQTTYILFLHNGTQIKCDVGNLPTQLNSGVVECSGITYSSSEWKYYTANKTEKCIDGFIQKCDR